jgi:mono/diheme cytochrome c family protein
VKFPPLWDIWRLDWVQYNASVRQPMVRNAGEALGVRAETNFRAAGAERWRSSVMVANLDWMEQALHTLRPPVWPAEVLGGRNEARYAAGRALFAQRCAGCHGVHVTAGGEWRVAQVPLDHIGTDPNEATGFLTHRYDARALGLGASIDGATALREVTERIKDAGYDALHWTAAQRAAADGDGRANQVVARAVYKARPLVGIWASPPYLHNGAVPTLFDLLSPERPARFAVGSREYDPVHVGYSTAPFPGAQMRETTQPGNSNAGHWFADDARPGRIGRALSEPDRMAILEYLKFVVYRDYPCTDAESGQPRSGAVCGW